MIRFTAEKLSRIPPLLRQRYESDPVHWEKAVLVALGEGPPTRATFAVSAASGPGDLSHLIAPLGCLDLAPERTGGWPHEGRPERKPWDYRVTATFAHLETPSLIPFVVELLRLQTCRPYVVVVDTGSSPGACEELESYRSEDVEIHFLRAHAWRHSSEPVAAACDLALALCKTEHLFFTHVDCFLRRRSVLAEYRAKCGPGSPIVGYALTDRSHATREWRWMVGHTCLMAHVPTLRRANVWWGYDWGRDRGVRPAWETYFDTETEFCWAAKAAGLAIVQTGEERNFERNITDDFDHPRSWATSKVYRSGDDEYNRRKDGWIRDATAAAALRIRHWRALAADPSGPGDPEADAKDRVLCCPHRSSRWSCSEEVVTCGLGKGQAGIVDLRDCLDCVEVG